MELILKKIAKLIDLKSMLTIAFGITFCVLTYTGFITSENFMSVFMMVITFYFTRTTGDDTSSTSGKNNSGKNT